MTAEISEYWTRIALSPRRQVVDAQGRLWTVFEMKPPAYDRRQANALVFDGDMIVRRILSFPHDWYDLHDDELMALARTV